MSSSDNRGKELDDGESNKDENVSVDIPNGHDKPNEPRQSTIVIPPEEPQPYKDYFDPPPTPFWDRTEFYRWSLWRAVIAEFFASFLFLYISVQTAIGASTDGTCGGVGTLGIAFAFGVTIFVLVYCTAGISGGHINTAVTFAMFLARRVSAVRALLYAVAQMLGALAGVGLVKAYQRGYYQRYGGGANYVHHGYSKGAGLGAEIVGTFFLVYVIFTATDAKRKVRDAHVPVLAPLTIGFTVFIVHLATIPITGTGINPARSFAAAVYWDHHSHAWHDHWIFWVGPIIGATIAVIYHQAVIRALPFRNIDFALLTRGRAV